MTANSNAKRMVRARAARTGESYTTALHRLRGAADAVPVVSHRLAVAQTVLLDDPRDEARLRANGRQVRRMMTVARRAGAQIVHFPEGATCSPHKRVMSRTRDVVGPADWTRMPWAVLAAELRLIAAHAERLGLWTVLGSVHPLTPTHRPHNSVYVISDRGTLVTRYDERMLSQTKSSFLYTPGAGEVTFTVDGLRFGLALAIEAHYPELFLGYEQRGVDCVLFSTAGPAEIEGGVFALEAQAAAASNSIWVSYAGPARARGPAPSGIVAPSGRWVARCPDGATPAVAVADLGGTEENLARRWRRTARLTAERAQAITDSRSQDRAAF
jgi:predicted amidohydrolase